MGNSFTRRQFLKQTAAAGAASITAGCLPGFKPISKGVSVRNQHSRRNILFISVDDLRTQQVVMDILIRFLLISINWPLKAFCLSGPIARCLSAAHREPVL